MTKKKLRVKHLAALESFGGVTILCSKDTVTLSEGEIVLGRHVNMLGQEDDTFSTTSRRSESPATTSIPLCFTVRSDGRARSFASS